MHSVARAAAPRPLLATGVAVVTAAAMLPAAAAPPSLGPGPDSAPRLLAAAADLADLPAGPLAEAVMDAYSALMPWGELTINVLAFGAASFVGGYLAEQLLDNPFDLFFAHPYPTDPSALDPLEQAVFNAGYWLNDETLFPTNNPPHVDGALGILPSLLQYVANVMDGTSPDTAWDEFTANLTLALQTWLPFVGTGQPVTDDADGVTELAAQALGSVDPATFGATGADLPDALTVIP